MLRKIKTNRNKSEKKTYIKTLINEGGLHFLKKLCSYTVLQPKKKRIQAPPRLMWASVHLISHQSVKGSTTKTKDISSKPARIKYRPAHFAMRSGLSVVHINRQQDPSSLFLRPNNQQNKTGASFVWLSECDTSWEDGTTNWFQNKIIWIIFNTIFYYEETYTYGPLHLLKLFDAVLEIKHCHSGTSGVCESLNINKGATQRQSMTVSPQFMLKGSM